MRRELTIELEVGDAADSECGECPFRALDFDLSGRYLCTCPAWEPAEVTAGRHRACIEAGEDHEGTSRLSVALDLRASASVDGGLGGREVMGEGSSRVTGVRGE